MSPQSPRLDVLITPDLLMFWLVEYWSTGDSWPTRLKARPPQKKKKKQISNFQGRDSASQGQRDGGKPGCPTAVGTFPEKSSEHKPINCLCCDKVSQISTSGREEGRSAEGAMCSGVQSTVMPCTLWESPEEASGHHQDEGSSRGLVGDAAR
jgi:hypothetical protein